MIKVARKNPESIVKQIFEELLKNGAKSTNEIAIAMNSDTRTIKNYVDLIELVQHEPPIVVERTKNVTVVRIEKKTVL